MIFCFYMLGMIITWLCFLYANPTESGWVSFRKHILWPIVFGKFVFQVFYKIFIDENYEIN